MNTSDPYLEGFREVCIFFFIRSLVERQTHTFIVTRINLTEFEAWVIELVCLALMLVLIIIDWLSESTVYVFYFYKHKLCLTTHKYLKENFCDKYNSITAQI